MKRLTRSETARFLLEHDNYLILSHRRPDGDTTGSSAALCLGLRQLGSNLRLRYAPEIVWAEDDSITYGAKMLDLINSLGVKHDEESDPE